MWEHSTESWPWNGGRKRGEVGEEDEKKKRENMLKSPLSSETCTESSSHSSIFLFL